MLHVGFDHRALLLNQKRSLVLSGAIHYPRSTTATWPALMARSKEAGLNTVETYVFWNLHERQRGVFDFSDRLDLLLFCKTAQEHGLNVILRIGPYICAETNFGGLPPWLRDLPGLRTRTYNLPFMSEMERWSRLLCDYLRPMFAPQGGPIVMAQFENEYNNIAKNYGEDGQKYLQWSVQLGQSLNLGVPLIMCAGSVPGAIETINHFFGHEGLDSHFKHHPDQPALWTELYPAWYDIFGYPHHTRTPQDLAYSIARFFAAGGTGINYYMWHGGTNFGRETMYLQTTSYDFDAPLDEYALPTTKSHHLGRLHALLSEHAAYLLDNERAPAQSLGPKQTAFVYRHNLHELQFVSNDDTVDSATVTFLGQTHVLPPRTTLILRDGQLLMDTSQINPIAVIHRSMQPLDAALSPAAWFKEPLPQAWPSELSSPTVSHQPVEQLSLTHDSTDYCWYSIAVDIPADHKGKSLLTLPGVADLVHIYVDGKLKASTPTPLKENRGKIDEGFAQSFKLHLSPGRHQLNLLCTALGLIKGDWMLGFQNMADERKGLWGTPTLNGLPIPGPWTMQPGLVGEKVQIHSDPGVLVSWKTNPTQAVAKPLVWWKFTFNRPPSDHPLALDLGSMNKGIAWLNGRCIGRYWLVKAAPISSDAWLIPNGVIDTRVGEPTQRHYHLPDQWMQDKNDLVLLEEVGGGPAGVKICQWK